MLHVLFANSLLFKSVAKIFKTAHVVPETISLSVKRNVFPQQAETISKSFSEQCKCLNRLCAIDQSL